MAAESLLVVQAELLAHGVNEDLIIHRLSSEVLAAWMQGGGRHGVHRGFADRLYRNWYTELPNTKTLIITCCYESSVFVAEGHSVYSSQMLIVFLRHLARVYVPLYDLLVGAAREEDILLIVVRVELHAVGDSAVAEGAETLSCLCIPEIDVTIVATTEEFSSII